MLKSLPLELQVVVERTLRGFGITNNDDPLVQVATALGLYAAYFEKIPERITDAGKTIDTQNAAALAALDIRLRVMRGFAVIIQTATDRLGTVPQEIVDQFPSQAVAEALRKDIDAALKTLPLSKFEESVNRANTNMGTFITDAKTHNDKLEKELSRLQKNAADIADLAIPGVSWWRDAGFILLSAGVTALVMWWFVVKADAAEMKSMVDSEGFIGTRAVAGYYNDQPVIIIPKDYFKDAKVDETTGNLTVHLNK